MEKFHISSKLLSNPPVDSRAVKWPKNEVRYNLSLIYAVPFLLRKKIYQTQNEN